MPIASVVITANPVTAWEQFTLTLGRADIEGPRVEHRDVGGYWSFKFAVQSHFATRPLASDFLANGLMRHVEVFNEKGIKDWEGFISSVRMNTGTARIESDLDNMANRAWVRYNSGGSVLRSTTINNADSQARFGIKEQVLVGGQVNLGVADQHAQQIIYWIGWPSPGVREINLGGATLERPQLEITCLGYWHTLGWRTYNQTVLTTDTDASLVVGAVLDDMGQFVRAQDISDNTTQVTQEYDEDRTADSIVKSITALGDGAFHKWVAGFREDRTFYYKQAARPDR